MGQRGELPELYAFDTAVDREIEDLTDDQSEMLQHENLRDALGSCAIELATFSSERVCGPTGSDRRRR